MTRRLLLFIPLALFVALGVFLWLGLGQDPAARDSALLAKPFPDFRLATLDDPGRQVDRTLLDGQVTLVNVWGEWCPTCKREMPQLLALQQRGVRLIGVDYKDSREKGQAFLAEFGNPFELNLFDPDGALGFDLGVYGAPESFIVDAHGVIRYHHTGYITPDDVDTVVREVRKWQR